MPDSRGALQKILELRVTAKPFRALKRRDREASEDGARRDRDANHGESR